MPRSKILLHRKGVSNVHCEAIPAKAAEFRALLTDTSRSPSEITEFRDLKRIYTTLAENEEWMTIHLDKTIQRSKDRENRTALANEEEQILKCLGAALVMRWNTVPAKLQRELFDCASTIGNLLETAPLKGQIARFLHNHKNDQKVVARGPDSRKDSEARRHSLMASVACPKCLVVAYETGSGGWRFEPATGCVDLRDTKWGAKGELESCPTLAATMPDEVFWPGRSHRDHVMHVARQAQNRKREP